LPRQINLSRQVPIGTSSNGSLAQSVSATGLSTSLATSLATSGEGVDGMIPSWQSDPSWIEAQATLVGYVKHPLEQILEWLDQGLLWLETLIARLWQWLKKMTS
jgi:hypothetical protein